MIVVDLPMPVPIVSMPLAAKPTKAFPAPVPIKLIKVLDGDTIRVLLNGQVTKIRFACVDAPESDQPIGDLATRALGDFLEGQNLTLVTTGTDLYGRTIGSVYTNGESVSVKMVRIGLSFYYTQFRRCPELQDIIQSENNARSDRMGTWSFPAYTAPWDWRKLRKQNKLPVSSLGCVESAGVKLCCRTLSMLPQQGLKDCRIRH